MRCRPRRRARSLLASLLCAGLAACSQSKLAPHVREALQSEGDAALPTNSVTSKDGQLHGTVEATGLPRVEIRGEEGEDSITYRLEIPIGVEEPIRCVVSPRPFAIGAAAAKLLSGKLIDESTAQRIAGLEAGAVGDRPFVYAQVVGTANQDGARALYQAKFFLAPLRGGAMHCIHIGLGYTDTVRRVLTGLLSSLELVGQPEEATPAYHEITLTRVGPVTCGFNETRFYQRADGGWGAVHRSVLVAPRSLHEAIGMDQVRVTSADVNGVIDHAASDSFDGDSPRFSLAVERTPLSSQYAINGELHGKAVDNNLPSRAPLRDDVSLARQIAAGTSGGTWTMPQWVPEVDPLRSVDVQVTCPPRQGTGDVACEVAAGKVHLQAIIDAHGMARRTTLKTGKIEMQTERVYARGTF